MSLINQMLKDLEERHATGAESGRLHSAVRALPPARPRTRWGTLVALVALAGVGSAGWWFGLRQEATAARPTPATASRPAATGPTAPAPQPALAGLPPLAPLPAASAAPSSEPVVPQGPEAVLPTNSVRPAALSEPPSGGAKPRERNSARRDAPEMVALAQPAKPRRAPAPPQARDAEAAPAETAALAETAATGRADAPGGEHVAPAVDEALVVEEAVAIDKQMRWGSIQERAEADYRRGVRLYEEGRTSEAERAWREALETDPANASARHALLGLMLERGEREQAMRVVQEGLVADPGQHKLRMILARMQLDRGSQTEALRTLEAGLSDPAAGADYLTTAAAVMARAGRNREAGELYQRALSLGPGNPVWYMGLGLALRAEGRGAEALAAFERARAPKSLSPELQAFVERQVRELR